VKKPGELFKRSARALVEMSSVNLNTLTQSRRMASSFCPTTYSPSKFCSSPTQAWSMPALLIFLSTSRSANPAEMLVHGSISTLGSWATAVHALPIKLFPEEAMNINTIEATLMRCAATTSAKTAKARLRCRCQGLLETQASSEPALVRSLVNALWFGPLQYLRDLLLHLECLEHRRAAAAVVGPWSDRQAGPGFDPKLTLPRTTATTCRKSKKAHYRYREEGQNAASYCFRERQAMEGLT
jgi:hypothetical protein